MLKDGGETKMWLFLIVCDQVLDEEVCNLLPQSDTDRHVKVDKVQGCWKEKHLRTHVWPGEYHAIITMLTEEQAQTLGEEIKKLRKKFPCDEIWAWKLPLEATI